MIILNNMKESRYRFMGDGGKWCLKSTPNNKWNFSGTILRKVIRKGSRKCAKSIVVCMEILSQDT